MLTFYVPACQPDLREVGRAQFAPGQGSRAGSVRPRHRALEVSAVEGRSRRGRDTLHFCSRAAAKMAFACQRRRSHAKAKVRVVLLFEVDAGHAKVLYC